MDSKPSGNLKVNVDEDELATLRDLLNDKVMEMSKRELDSQLTIRKLRKELSKVRVEKEVYRLEVEHLKQDKCKNWDVKAERHVGDVSKPIMIIDDSDDESKPPNGSQFLPPPNSNHENDPYSNVAASPTLDDLYVDHPPPLRHSPSPSVRLERSPSLVRDLTPQKEIPPDAVEVKVKIEGIEDEFKFVSFVKSEDGLLDIWNLDGFDLGPPVKVADKFNRGFSRKVISDAFGGGHQEVFHHWGGKKARGKPMTTFSRGWNPQLPAGPGQHGVVFCSFHKFNDGTKVDRPIPFFIGEGRNDWRLYGNYSLKRWGEISPAHLTRLPPTVLSLWIRGALRSDWGKQWINETNAELEERARETGVEARLVEYTEVGLTEALNDGRLISHFTIMKCVEYDVESFHKLLQAEKHPKPPKSGSKANSPQKAKPAAASRRRGAGKVDTDVESVDSDSENEMHESSRKRKSRRNLRSATGAKKVKAVISDSELSEYGDSRCSTGRGPRVGTGVESVGELDSDSANEMMRKSRRNLRSAAPAKKIKTESESDSEYVEGD